MASQPYYTNTTAADLQALAVSGSTGPGTFLPGPEFLSLVLGAGSLLPIPATPTFATAGSGKTYSIKVYVMNMGATPAKIGKVAVWYNLESRYVPVDNCAPDQPANKTFEDFSKTTLAPGKGKWITLKGLTSPSTATITTIGNSVFFGYVVVNADCSKATQEVE